MTDTIYINDLTLSCVIGVTDTERAEKQPVVINIALSIDLQKPAETDNILDTVDYKKLYLQIVKLVGKSRFQLLERLTGSIASICLKYPQVKQVKVHVAKPHALKLSKSASVEILRKNEE